MDARAARELIALNNRFYEENAASFSATRSAPWQGWGRCLDVARCELGFDAGASTGRGSGDAAERLSTLRVLDVACGNLRFEDFLAHEIPNVACECFAVDSCATLADAGEREGESSGVPVVRFRELDVLALLVDALEGAGAASAKVDQLARTLAGAFDVPPCDLAVCFGFMHHIPVRGWRMAVLRALVECLRPGGVVCVSFWQFLDDERLARKADEATVRAAGDMRLAQIVRAFNQGDCLLGWQDRQDSFRYCHHFSDAEIDALAASVAGRARTIARFRADGRSGDLNEYVVLQVQERLSGD